tara:strand:- start:1568 stop:1858 length:291 start_codon:yes stop_codon:yes gene_type:complete
LSVVKSKIIKELSNNYPNFLKKDLNKLFDIIIDNIKNSLKNNERIELRDIFTLDPKIQKPRLSRNPQNNALVKVPEKKTIRFKMSKKWIKKINEKK